MSVGLPPDAAPAPMPIIPAGEFDGPTGAPLLADAPLPVPAAPVQPKNIGRAVANQNAAEAGRQDVANEAIANADEQAAQSVAGSQEKADLTAKQVKEDEDQAVLHKAALDRAQTDVGGIEKDVANTKFHNLYQDLSAPRKIGVAIAQILGGFSFEPNHVNRATQALDKAVADDLTQQKEDLNRKYAVLAQKNTDLHGLRTQFEYEDASLKVRQSRQLDATAAHIDSLAARSKNQEGIIKAKALAAELRAHGAALGTEGFSKIAAYHHTTAETAKLYADIAKEKAGAKQEAETFKEVNKEIETARKEGIGTGNQGPLITLRAANGINKLLTDAMAKRDAAKANGDKLGLLKANSELFNEAQRAVEGAGPLLSGGKTTRFGGKVIENAQTLQDELTKIKGKFLGSNEVGDSFVNMLKQFAEGREKESIGALQDIRKASVDRALGPGGVASSPRAKAHYQASINATLGLPDDAPTAPGKVPPGGVPGKLNGKAGYALDGKFVAF